MYTEEQVIRLSSVSCMRYTVYCACVVQYRWAESIMWDQTQICSLLSLSAVSHGLQLVSNVWKDCCSCWKWSTGLEIIWRHYKQIEESHTFSYWLSLWRSQNRPADILKQPGPKIWWKAWKQKSTLMPMVFSITCHMWVCVYFFVCVSVLAGSSLAQSLCNSAGHRQDHLALWGLHGVCLVVTY